jgi:hypothetical protein
MFFKEGIVMAKYYREPNQLKRLWGSVKEDFKDSDFGCWCAKHWRVWKTDRYIQVWRKGDWCTPAYKEAIPVYRIRFWPVHIIQLVGLWIGYNMLLLAWFMVSFMAGRTVSFTPLPGWHEPLMWFMDLFR